MKYKLVIFDCDGTLVDTESALNKAISHTLNKMGYKKYTPEYCLENFIGISFPDLVKILQAEVGENFNVKEFADNSLFISNQFVLLGVQAMPNANEVLEKLKNIKKCVASNGNKEVVVNSLKTTKLYQYFNPEHIFTYEQVAHPKPKPDLFLYAARQMGCEPDECLVIEDSLVGVTAAKAAAMDVLAYKHFNGKFLMNLEKLQPTAIIDSLSHILNYVNIEN